MPTRMPGVTTSYSTQSQPATSDKTVPFEGGNGIGGTGRCVSTMGAQQGADKVTVALYQDYQEAAHFFS